MHVENMQPDEREAFDQKLQAAGLRRPAKPGVTASAKAQPEWDEEAIGWEAVAQLAAIGGGLTGV